MTQEPINPVQRLWCAVILQAVVDMESGAKIKRAEQSAKSNIRSKFALKDLIVIRQDAFNWAFDHKVYPGSFVWICDMCELDQRKILNLIQTKQGRKALLFGLIKERKQPLDG